MKSLITQKRLASHILGVGINRVRFDIDRLDDIQEALTKADIRDLIKDNAISSKPIKKRRVKIRYKRRGTGKRKKTVRRRKQTYVKLIRKLRKHLALLKQNNIITSAECNKLRLLAKAGQFKSLRHLKDQIQTMGKGEIPKQEQPKIKKENKTKEKKDEKKDKTKKKGRK